MVKTGQSVQRQLQGGGELDATKFDRESVMHAAQALGVAFFDAQCDRARSRSAVFRAIAKGVDFPLHDLPHYFSDINDLFECLCDTVRDQKVGMVLWLHKLHSGDPALKEDAARIVSACVDVTEMARQSGHIFAYAIEHVGAHPVVEPVVDPAVDFAADSATDST